MSKPRNVRVFRYQYELTAEGRNGRPESSAMVYLYDADSTLVGVLAFSDAAERKLPSESELGCVLAHFPREELAPVVDLLRNEKPVYLGWDPAACVLRLTTDFEPVGEEERRRLLKILTI